MTSIINHKKIEEILIDNQDNSRNKIIKIIDKAREKKGLTLEETAALLQVEDQKLIEQIFMVARNIKDEIYGDRVVLFAPLYISNKCINNCLYCGFRKDNRDLKRISLTLEEIGQQVKVIEKMGHKRILIEFGEDPRAASIEKVVEAIEAVYESGDIRRVNVNVAAVEVEDFKKLKAAGIGTYQLFQETYHPQTYEQMHPSGPKSDYEYHLTAMDRAMEAGIDDIGLGVLFGLYDYKYEVLAMLEHAIHLEEEYGVGPHTISIPRWKPAFGVDKEDIPAPVSDEEFKKLVAIIRLAVPYTGMILSTREGVELREELLELGISQMSAGSCTDPGGYKEENIKEKADAKQFRTADHRTPDKVIKGICDSDYLPSFCTACYRTERTGERFMDLAKVGEIHKFCQPNALITFQEYLEDYASRETKRSGERLISEQLRKIEDSKLRKRTKKRIEEVKEGVRDIYL
ncbi:MULTISPECIES: [FeFe] hydrogenase H-cluster radical SAM maturase HydG [unclassified Candidatus Frackibacter]|uniref:[FeFe] hydrogenase H-cluster radical SAM maturase HydG n=1 Tax=unclassified Candidatus Frackibacter TaxID=2648818 RepID=UPI000887743F|nr:MULTISPECIES: [FeFe] hydrogenase H-cluster radical SAM maturase HydG [unclassified Candidatus Frackibacter]SDC43956.1 iron-only hydrogenase maturation protein HydG [Candidatus Frackibacter sp. WG11]SEM64266.1 iron-only hydrogenase maturation protein HydG [Candidatus Frackibacter sp. WG12]SFL68456.1 iron-only hydrogenase maturation protein HydG [Candidatus Frackibacter sp. WG13]